MFRRNWWKWGCVLLLAGVGAGAVAVRRWHYESELTAARQAVEQGRWETANRRLQRYLGAGRNQATAHALMAKVLKELGQWPGVLEHAGRVSAGHSLAPGAMLCAAEACLRLERGAEAERWLQRCLEQKPDSIEARRGLVHIYRWEKRECEARSLLAELYELVPAEERFRVLAEWFVVDYGQFRRESAQARLSRWLANAPRDIGVQVAVAKLAGEGGDYDRAIRLARDCLKRAPEHVEARWTLAEALLNSGRPQQAAETLKHWPPHQRDARYWELQGSWLQEYKADFDQAAACFRKVLKTRPDDWRTWHRLAACLRITGHAAEGERARKRADLLRRRLGYDEVGQLLKESLPALPAPQHSLRFAKLYEDVGRLQQARRWYSLVLQYEPNDREARAGLSRLQQPQEAARSQDGGDHQTAHAPHSG